MDQWVASGVTSPCLKVYETNNLKKKKILIFSVLIIAKSMVESNRSHTFQYLHSLETDIRSLM